MVRLCAVLLLTPTCAAEPTGLVVIPDDPKQGVALGESTKAGGWWLVFSEGSTIPAAPSRMLEGGTIAVIVGTPGKYGVLQLWEDEDGSKQMRSVEVVIRGGTDPDPPPPPPPPPPGKRIVVIVYDVDTGLPLPPNDGGLQGVQDYVRTKHGTNAYRLLPDDSTATWATKYLSAVRAAKVSLPALAIDDGATVTASALPPSGAQTIAAIKESGG